MGLIDSLQGMLHAGKVGLDGAGEQIVLPRIGGAKIVGQPVRRYTQFRWDHRHVGHVGPFMWANSLISLMELWLSKGSR